jgi:hypothetical protein
MREKAILVRREPDGRERSRNGAAGYPELKNEVGIVRLHDARSIMNRRAPARQDRFDSRTIERRADGERDIVER